MERFRLLTSPKNVITSTIFPQIFVISTINKEKIVYFFGNELGRSFLLVNLNLNVEKTYEKF